MATSAIKMPQLGESVTEGTVDKWLKQEGDFVKRDEPIVEVVTDKVNAEIPSPFEGKLVKIAVTEGETVRVGAVIAQIETAAQAATATAPAPAKEKEKEKESGAAATEVPPEPDGGKAPAPVPVAAPAASQTTPEHARLSPAVRKLAAEHSIDPTSLQGSGLGGRVTREDVLAAVSSGQAAEAAPAAPPKPAPTLTTAPARVDGKREELVKLSVMRKSIAEHMVRSLQTSPHAWTLQEVDVSNLVKYRETEKESFKSRHGATLTYLPFVAQIVCEALKQFPWLNSSWTDDGVVLKHYVNLGIAVAIPDGLIVPVVKDADQVGEAEAIGILDDRHDQSVGDRHRDAKVDVALEDHAVVAPRGVEPRELLERLAQDLRDEREIGEGGAVTALEAVLLGLAVADQVGHVDLLQGPRVRRSGKAADHVVGDRLAHDAELHELFAFPIDLDLRCRFLWRGGRSSGRRRDRGQHVVPSHTATQA